MDRVCRKYERHAECIQGSGGRARKKKRPLGRLRRKWVDNIQMYLREIGWCGMDWIHLAQVGGQWRVLVNTVMNIGIA
jgi:hypothetical protein